MKHYVAYHSSKKMGRTYRPDSEFSFLSEKPPAELRKAVGAWSWVIVGEPADAGTQFLLVGVYSPSAVTAGESGQSVIVGPGTSIDPPIALNELPWFQELLQKQGHFGFGFNEIRGAELIAELEEILGRVSHDREVPAGDDVITYSSRDNTQAHEELQEWRRTHEEGFVLNRVSASAGMIHRVTCPHLGDEKWTTESGQDFARKLKACSISLSLLRKWAIVHGVSSLSTCPDCNPTEDILRLPDRAELLLENGYYTPADLSDARERILTSIVQRRGQPSFRNCLLIAYEGRCAITGCNVEAALEAAHIDPYNGALTNHPQNGLLLRADIHTLFDVRLIAIDTTSMTILIAPELEQSTYASLAGTPLRLPKRSQSQPSIAALDRHRQRSGLTLR